MGFDVVARFDTGICDRIKLNAGNSKIFGRVVAAKYACSHNCSPQNARFGKLMNGQKLRPVLHVRIHQEFNARKGS
jgi:hypothetical protein